MIAARADPSRTTYCIITATLKLNDAIFPATLCIFIHAFEAVFGAGGVSEETG